MPLFSRGGGSGTGTPDRPDKSDKSASNDDPPTPSSSSKSFSARLLRRRPSAKVVPPLVDPGDTETSASASASEPPTASSDGFSLGPPVPPLHLRGHDDHDVVNGEGGRGGWMARGQFGSVSPRIKRPPRPHYATSASGSGSASGTGTVVIDAGGPAPTWTTPLSFGTGPLASTSAGPGGSGSWHDAWEQDASWARARRSADEVRGASPDSPPLYPTPLSPPRRNTAPRVRPPIPQPTALPGPSITTDGADASTDPDAGEGADVVGSRAWLARKPSTGKLRRARPDASTSTSAMPSPVLRRTQPQRSPIASRPPTTPEQYPSRGRGLQPSPVLLTASSSSQSQGRQQRGGGGDDWSVGGSASVESSDLDGEGEIGLGASAVADPGVRRRTPSPTLMPSRVPQRAGGGGGGGYEVQVSCVAAPAQPALELEPPATAKALGADGMGTGEITWTITIRPRPGAGGGGREAAAPSSPLHISASLPGSTPDQPAGEAGAGAGATLATAPLSASSVNLSLSLSQPVGKMVFISFPLDMTPRRTARRPSRSSRRAGTAGSPPPSVHPSDRPDGSGSGWPEVPGTTTREKRSGWILGSPSPSPSGEVEDDLPLTPPRIRTPGAPTPSTPPRMTTPPPNPITPRRVLKYGPQNGQGPSGSPARTPRRSRESPLVFPSSAHGAASRDASLSRAVGRRSLDGRPGFGAAYGSSGGSGASSGSAGTEDIGGSSLGGGSARRSRIVSASDLDGGLYAPGTVDGLSEELERAL